jgi:hypothetical protein
VNHKFGEIFRRPVDPVKLGIPDYFEVIKKPMDLSTIYKNLTSRRKYSTFGDCDKDIMLMFQNCLLYNDPHLDIYKMCLEVRAFYDDIKKKNEDLKTG